MTDEEREEPARRAPLLRRPWRGVRARIITSYLVLLTLGTAISILAVREALLVRLDDRVEHDLRQEVDEFRRLANEGVDPRTGEPFGADVHRLFTVYLQRNIPGAGEELLTVPREGQPRFRYSERAESAIQEGIDPALIARWRRLEVVEEGELQTASGQAHYHAIPVVRDGRSLGSFVVAIFTDEEREEVNDSVGVVAAVSGGVLLVGTLLAFLAAGRVLAPMRELRDTARSIEASDLTRRIETEGEDEIAELARTFNGMLDRLELAFASQREFLRDAGHELRTPLTIIRGHLELLSLEPERTEETIALVADELDRMSRFVDDLLLLAKSEHPDFLQLRTVVLSELAGDLLSKAEQLAPRRWVLDEASARVIVADPQRLTQAVMNLADNAARLTGEEAEIGIGASADGDWARLWVRDTGPGVSAEDATRIFERFERGRGQRSYEGSGLGLAIVRAIAEAHGGRVELADGTGPGARFEIVIPVDATEHLSFSQGEAR